MIKYLKQPILVFLITLLFLSQNSRGQGCKVFTPPLSEYRAEPIFTRVEANWFPEWIEQKGKVYPQGLEKQEKWLNPYMKVRFASSMHEDPYATDVTNLPGPTMENLNVQYFRVREKGGGFSGMVPSYAFLDENTMIAPSFGRATTTLLIIDISDSLKVIDMLPIPGRGNTALELAGKKGRLKIFKDTSGGAYFYLSDNNHVYIPGTNNAIIRVTIEDRKFVKDNIQYIDLGQQILDGSLRDEGLDEKEALNKLTSLMPDKHGNIWFTSKYGIIGMIHRNDKFEGSDCPKVYSTLISQFGALPKIEKFFGQSLESEDEVEALRMLKETGEFTPEVRIAFREQFHVDEGTREEIQNSFSINEDGVFIVSNMALYKMKFNDDTKQFELDPEWNKNFSDLVYENDRIQKSGHLNNGSGTTPTLIGDEYVVIVDNAPSQVNICIYDQKTGKLVFKHPLFEPGKSACENSVIAYKNSLFVGNTFGYDDPFITNDTPGGLMRFDLDESTSEWSFNNKWPERHIDIKTATPKLSTASGLLYIYNRSEIPVNGHYDWQITALDVESGLRSYYIKPYLEKKEFGENVSFIMRGASLGNKNYDRKVFNNIWGTFTVGPNNSIFVATYRGFIKISSD